MDRIAVSGKVGVVLDDSPGELGLVLRVPPALVERVPEDVVNLVPVQDSHPVAPGVGAGPLAMTWLSGGGYVGGVELTWLK